MRVLGIIPARGGSKGIPRKNLVLLAGRPLLQFTVTAALGSTRLTRTILSSDDGEIIEAGRSMGVEAPFVRPRELATDDSTSRAVAQHALRFAEEQEQQAYDAVCLLQPTCPLRDSADIDRAVELLEGSDADAVISLTQVEEPHPFKMMAVEEGVVRPLFPDRWRETLRRQELPKAFSLNGAIYCTRRTVLLDQNSLWGKRVLPYLMPAERSVNVDASIDLKMAELIVVDSGTRK